MDLISALSLPEVWQRFYEYKRAGGHLRPAELEELESFVTSRGYEPVVARIQRGDPFPPPQRREISKLHTGKKRVVYTYPADENRVLKLLTWLLQEKYDHLLADNLYSFRRNKGVRDAVTSLLRREDIRQLWGYKVDISNYFNSVPVERLLPLLSETLSHQPEVYRFLEQLLTNPLVEDGGTMRPEKKGIMAGTPVSTFLANLYLSELDHAFQRAGVLYARYSDDIILFAPSREERERWIDHLHAHLAQAGLEINPQKQERTEPAERWTFLGICYEDGIVDVAPASVDKLKAKMRRKARALARWQARTGATGAQTAKAFIRVFHRKLFENPLEHELTWARWYFPLITTDRSLKVLDAYCQSCIRYLATGKRTKAAYNFRYQDMKALGYTTLVHRYYQRESGK